MLSEDDRLIRNINFHYWTLMPLRRLKLMLNLGFVDDKDLEQLPREVYTSILERAISNGDLDDLAAELRKEVLNKG